MRRDKWLGTEAVTRADGTVRETEDRVQQGEELKIHEKCLKCRLTL